MAKKRSNDFISQEATFFIMQPVVVSRRQFLNQGTREREANVDGMLSLEHAVKMNNESALLLCSGEEGGKAVLKLSQSLCLIRKLLAIQGRNIDQQEDDAIGGVELTSVQKPALPTDLSMNGLQDSNYFIYNHTMSVPAGHPRNPSHLPLYSACIVLNLAMAYHCLGTKGNQAAYKKAENLYSMSLQLLSLSHPDSICDTVLSMKILAVNNLAHVHDEKGHYEKSRYAIRQLSFLLQAVDSTGTFFSARDLHKFVLNVMLWGAPKMAAAA